MSRTHGLQVAWVRRRGVGRALPKAHLQADLDIATLPGSSPSETLLADAEVIRAVSEVCVSQHCEPLGRDLAHLEWHGWQET